MFKKFHHKTDINCNSLVQGERGSLIEGDEEEILKKFHSFLPLSCSSDVKGYEVYASVSKEELFSMFIDRSNEVQRLETKLKECESELADQVGECERLSVALERQQGGVLRKLQDLGETYNLDKKRSEAIISNLQESEKELIAAVGRLQKENVELHNRIEDYESEKEELERERREFDEKKSNCDRVFETQIHELAKLKHKLANSDKEAKKLQFELNESIAMSMQTRERNDELENQLHNLARKNEVIRASLSDANFEKNKLLKKAEETEVLGKILQAENESLKDKLSYLNVDLRKVRRSLSNVESTNQCVSDKYEYLKHSSETVLSKAQNDLEEKESKILHLESKLRLMEMRINDENLPEEEQIQSLVDQRNTLELKLDESHQQLTNIKTTWSETINQLETQVSHLNAKIAEDCEELLQKTNEINVMRKHAVDQEASFTSLVTSLKEDNRQLLTKNDALLRRKEELETKLTKQEINSNEKLNDARKLVEELEKKSMKNEKVFNEKVEELSQKLRDSVDILRCLKITTCSS